MFVPNVSTFNPNKIEMKVPIWLDSKASDIDEATGKLTTKIEGFGSSISNFFTSISGGIRDITDSARVKTDVSVSPQTLALLGIGLFAIVLLNKRR
jgi:hypothetical protein